MDLILATRNAHKTREFRELLGGEFRLRDLSAFPQIGEIAETGSTFEENAVIKALAVSRALPNELVIADDSGLEVDVLGGAPGVYSARFAGAQASDEENVARLLRELRDRPQEERAARFMCVIVAAADRSVLRVCAGWVEGEISRQPKGLGGFGYDPVFVPAGFDSTFAELGSAIKNELSHRARAVAELRKFVAASVTTAREGQRGSGSRSS